MMKADVRVSLYNFNKIYLTYFNILYNNIEYAKLKEYILVYYNTKIVIFPKNKDV